MSALVESRFCLERYQRDITKNGFSIWACNSKEEFVSFLSQVGTPNGHDSEGRILWDVRPLSTAEGARSHRFDEFTFHTDASFETEPPHGIALYVVKADRFGGGRTRLVDWWKLRQQLPVATLLLLGESVEIEVPAEFRKSAPSTLASIILRDGGIRYRRELIREEKLPAEMISALNEFDRLCAESSFQNEFLLESGQAIFIDNRRLLHARTEIKDPERYLIRARFS